MKKLFFPLFAGLLSCCAVSAVKAQEFKEHISKEFTVPQQGAGHIMCLYNVFGSVKVEGYSGDKVVIEVDKVLTARSNEELEKGKNELKLAFEQVGDSVVAYTSSPFDSRPNRNCCCNSRNDVHYSYRLNYTVKVPYNINLDVSTVNNGEITVKDVSGQLKVHNVNGGLQIMNAKGTTDAYTVNGSVVVSYLANPPGASSYHTINGDIRVNYPSTLAADMDLKTMHGDFYTNFDNVQMLPSKVVKDSDGTDNRTTYRIKSNAQLRIGGGGKTFTLSTLNGSIYIKKQS